MTDTGKSSGSDKSRGSRDLSRSNDLDFDLDFDSLVITVRLTGVMAVEVRRVCDNLNIGTTTFARKAIKGELRAMGIMVE